jgi:hypothetical protein
MKRFLGFVRHFRRSVYEKPSDTHLLSYGEANMRFEEIAQTVRGASANVERLWDEMLDSIERRDFVIGRLKSDFVTLARFAIFTNEFSNSSLERLNSKALKDGCNFTEEGVKVSEGALALVAEKAREVLRSCRINELYAVLGEPYDPNLHECKRFIKAGEPKGGVCGLIETGFIYKIDDRDSVLVRPVGVEISLGANDKSKVKHSAPASLMGA